MTVYSAVKAQEATAVMTIISNSNIANKLTITAQLSSHYCQPGQSQSLGQTVTCFNPPLSAIFSPWVILPLIKRSIPGSWYLSYWSMIHLACPRNFSIVTLFHHCFRFPCLSNCRPLERTRNSILQCGSITFTTYLSSNPWVISWPMTTPIPP